MTDERYEPVSCDYHDQLEAAAADRDPDLIYAFRDPEFEHLHGLARFQSLERRIRGSRETRTSPGNGTN